MVLESKTAGADLRLLLQHQQLSSPGEKRVHLLHLTLLQSQIQRANEILYRWLWGRGDMIYKQQQEKRPLVHSTSSLNLQAAGVFGADGVTDFHYLKRSKRMKDAQV